MAVVISIDAGTTSIRAVAVDTSGHVCAQRSRELTQYFPRPGWVEHDAVEIWSTTQALLVQIASDMDGQPIAAIGITNQRETVVAWNRRNGEPLGPAIVWQDRRTAERCEALAAEGLLPSVRATTGLVLDPYFSATKIEWMLRYGGPFSAEHVAFGTVDAWLLWNLTGSTQRRGAVFATDASNASRTMLYDIVRGAWDHELCDRFGVAVSQLPEVRSSIGVFGSTATGLGVPAGIAVAGVLGDQQAALFGQACLDPGMAKNTYGTGSFVLVNVGARCPPPVDGLLTTIAWQIGAERTYAYEGAIFITGAAVQWLRDGLGIVASAADIDQLAGSCDSTEGVYFVPAMTGLGSPWWDSHARGLIIGITRGTTRAHLARAALEAMAYQTRDVVDTMERASGTPLVSLRVDGGGAVNDLMLQFQADLLDAPVVRASVRESTALGAAYAAGIGAGVWTIDDVRSRWLSDREFVPAPSMRSSVDGRYAQWLRAVERARNWED